MARPPKISNEDILAAARQVFLVEGMGASTITIAEKAGISEASIFKRFSTKQALFLAAMGVTVEPDWAKALAKKTPTVAIKSELIELCGQMLGFYQEVFPRILMVMSQGKMRQAPPNIVPPPVHHKRLLADFIARAMGKGYLRRGNPETIAIMIVGTLINSVTTQVMLNRLAGEIPGAPQSAAASKQLVQALIDTLWVGIRPEG